MARMFLEISPCTILDWRKEFLQAEIKIPSGKKKRRKIKYAFLIMEVVGFTRFAILI